LRGGCRELAAGATSETYSHTSANSPIGGPAMQIARDHAGGNQERVRRFQLLRRDGGGRGRQNRKFRGSWPLLPARVRESGRRGKGTWDKRYIEKRDLQKWGQNTKAHNGILHRQKERTRKQKSIRPWGERGGCARKKK